MIEFHNISNITPYKIFKEKYDEALNAGQKNIEAISIASFNKEKNEVDSRFVNLKIIDNDKFIFFSNYNSPKSLAFESHNQVSVNIYWPVINLQIRMKAKISKKKRSYNQAYFLKRSPEKNALAISSNQSKSISSYDLVVKKYNDVKKDRNLQDEAVAFAGKGVTKSKAIKDYANVMIKQILALGKVDNRNPFDVLKKVGERLNLEGFLKEGEELPNVIAKLLGQERNLKNNVRKLVQLKNL